MNPSTPLIQLAYGFVIPSDPYLTQNEFQLERANKVALELGFDSASFSGFTTGNSNEEHPPSVFTLKDTYQCWEAPVNAQTISIIEPTNEKIEKLRKVAQHFNIPNTEIGWQLGVCEMVL